MKGGVKVNGQNMIYAIHNGKLIHISKVESGLKCNCTCPSCGEKLIARKGNKVTHHFAHNSKVECEYGYQTSIHLAAKEIISEIHHIQVPPLYLTFPGTGRKILLEKEQILDVLEVMLEKKINNIIPDILLKTNKGELILEIFVTHEIDDEKKVKIKKLDIPTIEIDLSKADRTITEVDLKNILLSKGDNKVWIYNGKREITYKKFVEVSQCKEIKSRNYALQVDFCPINKRIWKGKPYANFSYDCEDCDFLIDYKNGEEKDNYQGKILCSGQSRIGCLKDFDISLEERVKAYDEKQEETKYELISQGICPQCGYELKIRQGKYGEFFGCSNYPHCQFTFSYEENESG